MRAADENLPADCRTAVSTVPEQLGQLFYTGIFSSAARLTRHTLVQTVVLAEMAIVREPAFSPDGKWIAVVTQAFPYDSGR